MNQRMCRRSTEMEAPCQVLRAVPENETWQPPLLSSLLSSQLPSALLGRRLFMSLIITSVLPDLVVCVCVCLLTAPPVRYRSQYHRWSHWQCRDRQHVSHSPLRDVRSSTTSYHLAERCVQGSGSGEGRGEGRVGAEVWLAKSEMEWIQNMHFLPTSFISLLLLHRSHLFVFPDTSPIP